MIKIIDHRTKHTLKIYCTQCAFSKWIPFKSLERYKECPKCIPEPTPSKIETDVIVKKTRKSHK